MPYVRVEPGGHAFEADAGRTLMGAAQDAGLQWPTSCEGAGTCRVCVVRVLSGGASLTPVGPWEQEGLDEVGVSPGPGDEALRLACQARLGDDELVVHKSGVRRIRG